jgi:transcriptional regulator with XRE-family HTH domain
VSAYSKNEIVTLQSHCMAIALQHGSFRAAGDSLGIDHAYLNRLANGEASNPSDEVLEKLGLVAERAVIYRMRK